MSFSEILHWNLDGLSIGAEALSKRSASIEQYGSAVKNAPALKAWAGAASDQARTLASAHADLSEQIAAQAKSLIAPLNSYLTAGQDLKTEAQNLVSEAGAHGFEIQSDGSVQPTRPQSGLYAKAVAQQLAKKVTQIVDRDDQLQRSFANAVQSARSQSGAFTNSA